MRWCDVIRDYGIVLLEIGLLVIFIYLSYLWYHYKFLDYDFIGRIGQILITIVIFGIFISKCSNIEKICMNIEEGVYSKDNSDRQAPPAIPSHLVFHDSIHLPQEEIYIASSSEHSREHS